MRGKYNSGRKEEMRERNQSQRRVTNRIIENKNYLERKSTNLENQYLKRTIISPKNSQISDKKAKQFSYHQILQHHQQNSLRKGPRNLVLTVQHRLLLRNLALIVNKKLYQSIGQLLRNYPQNPKDLLIKGERLMKLREKMKNNKYVACRPLFWNWFFKTTEKGSNSIKEVADRLVLFTNINKVTAFYRMAKRILIPKAEVNPKQRSIKIILNLLTRVLLNRQINEPFLIFRQYSHENDKDQHIKRKLERVIELTVPGDKSESIKKVVKRQKRSNIIVRIMRNGQRRRNNALGLWLKKIRRMKKNEEFLKNKKIQYFKVLIENRRNNVNLSFQRLKTIPSFQNVQQKVTVQKKQQGESQKTGEPQKEGKLRQQKVEGIQLEETESYDERKNRLQIKFFNSLGYNTYENLIRSLRKLSYNSVFPRSYTAPSLPYSKIRKQNNFTFGKQTYMSFYEKQVFPINSQSDLSRPCEPGDIEKRILEKIKRFDEMLRRDLGRSRTINFMRQSWGNTSFFNNNFSFFRANSWEGDKRQRAFFNMKNIINKFLLKRANWAFDHLKYSSHGHRSSSFEKSKIFTQNTYHYTNHNIFVKKGLNSESWGRKQVRGTASLGLILILFKHFLRQQNSGFYCLVENMIQKRSSMKYEQKLEENLELLGQKRQLIGQISHFMKNQNKLDSILRKREDQLGDAQLQVEILKIRINSLLLNKFVNTLDQIYFKKLIQLYDYAFDAIITQANVQAIRDSPFYYSKEF